MRFIHQEVYVDNEIENGLREPLREFEDAVKAALR